MLVDYLFGPVVGGLFGGAMDVIEFMLNRTAVMPGFYVQRDACGVYLRPILL